MTIEVKSRPQNTWCPVSRPHLEGSDAHVILSMTMEVKSTGIIMRNLKHQNPRVKNNKKKHNNQQYTEKTKLTSVMASKENGSCSRSDNKIQ